ncbi:MAG: cysteine hydrolase family protein [Bryobacteraceae bacterium]|nr:cysteine hydrolase family protein [Bryobacteraceae bacterium]MDW8378770.1 cysteine hydrolase family protein [Bryobacterales bacterium]
MKTVFFDVDTQLDFLYPAGALYVPQAERLTPVIAHLNRLAASRGLVVISTMDAHAEDDPEFRQWPPHCVSNTVGQQKPAMTLLERKVTIPSAPAHLHLNGAQQILLEKQTTDCFTNPNLRTLLETLQVRRAVVYGVVTEICVRNAARGLWESGTEVVLITDAIQCLEESKAREFLDEVRQHGGRLASVAEIEAELQASTVP